MCILIQCGELSWPTAAGTGMISTNLLSAASASAAQPATGTSESKNIITKHASAMKNIERITRMEVATVAAMITEITAITRTMATVTIKATDAKRNLGVV